MREHAVLDGRDLTSGVERLASRFATACGATAHGRQVREFAQDLLVDVVDALRVASIGEIADALAKLERRPKVRASAGARTPSAESPHDKSRPAHPRKRPLPAAQEALPLGVESPASRRIRDPFDITKPGELLEPTFLEARREDDLPPSSERRASGQRTDTDANPLVAQPKRPPAATVARKTEAVEVPPPPPAVTLREGEQLLRASGSGVIIRRARIA